MKKLLAVLDVALMLGWVALVVVGMEFVVGWILTWIVGRETLMTPVWEAVYSMVAYVAAFVMLEFLTPVLENLAKNWRKTVTKKRTTQGEMKMVVTITNDDATGFQPVSRAELGLKGLPTWLDIVFAILGYITTIAVAAGLSAIFQNFPWFDAEQTQNLLFSPYLDGAERIIAFTILVVVAPIAEELIFRGWLYGKVRRGFGKILGKWGAIIASILLVSVLFGAIHGQWNVGLTTFVLSVVACILREMTGTIYAGTLVHIIQNGVAFYLLYVVGMM